MQTRIQEPPPCPSSMCSLTPTRASFQRERRALLDVGFDRIDHPHGKWAEAAASSALKRAVAGGSIFMTEYRAIQYPGEVSFATKVRATLFLWPINPGQELMVHRHGFLCATPQANAHRRLPAEPGRGHLRRRVDSSCKSWPARGTAWLELSGELITKNLQPGEVGACILAMWVRSRLRSDSRSLPFPESKT